MIPAETDRAPSSEPLSVGLPPVALLPDPARPLAPLTLSPRQAQLLNAACTAIADLPIFTGPVALTAGLDRAWHDVSALGASLPVADGVAASQLPPAAPTQSYFRTRVQVIDAEVAAAHAVAVIARCLEDLRYAAVAGSDLVRETAAMVRLLRAIGSAGATGVDDALPKQRPALDGSYGLDGVPVEQRWHYRWIVAHQLHGLIAAHTAAAIGAAISCLKAGDLDDAAELLETATALVEGMGATRSHAASFPAAFYNDVLRLTMRPPSNATALSGAMHPESRMFRKALRQLLGAEPRGFADLAAEHPAVATARERLLNAALIDAERHVCLVEAMIGADISIAQPDAGADNAVSALRSMRHGQAIAYAPFVRYADTLGR